MNAPMRSDRLLTIDEYADLPDDGWVTELVAGRIAREPQPSYEHGRVQLRIGLVLSRHVEEHAPDLTCVGPFGVIVGEATVRGPDVAVIRRERAADLHRAGFLRGAPDLAVEVVSPSNLAAQIHAKVGEYLAAGARAVWVVYPGTRTVAVHESPRLARYLGEEDVLTGGELLPELRVRVEELFR